jgi:ATP-dependent RNA helicase DeaD
MTTFSDFGLDPAIEAAVGKLGFENPTPVQTATIPSVLEGQDVIGQARTGSGKTAAFGLPMLERLKDGGKKPRGLILAPTRELALQVSEAMRSFAKGLPVRIVTIYGGSPYPPQLKALRNGACIVVGTPGRIIDHMERGSLDLSQVEMFVLDEADEMLRMGFIEAVEQVLEVLPAERQIALFSATMPEPIQRVSSRFLNNPKTLKVEATSLTVDHIEQFWIRAPARKKLDTLCRILTADPSGATLIFTRTRRGCAEVADTLTKWGIRADALHGDLNQAARERVINRLRSKSLNVVVATDVAARGIDVAHLSRVINLDYPNSAETYTHRIGRTGRAGAKGTAITLVTPSEQRKLRFLQKAIKYDIKQMDPPSNMEIANLQRNALWKEIENVLTEVDLGDEYKWLGELEGVDAIDPLALASAAIHLLNKARGINLAPPKPEPKPDHRDHRDHHSRDDRGDRGERRAPRDNAAFNRVNEVELFLSVGKFAGVRPGDIVGALANEFDISGSEIGRVSIFDKKAFVGLPRSVAERILAETDSLILRGRPTHLALSRPRQNEDAGWKGPKKRQFNKGKRDHHRRKKWKK